MDHCIVGHDETKRGILLALTAREHVYIEGPPGTAKTMLAEVTDTRITVSTPTLLCSR
jgi:MoxR-like ATPase